MARVVTLGAEHHTPTSASGEVELRVTPTPFSHVKNASAILEIFADQRLQMPNLEPARPARLHSHY